MITDDRDPREGCQPELPGLYVSIPFCRAKCRYCAIPTEPDSGVSGRYRRALCREAESASASPLPAFGSIYIGGGTPVVLPVAELSGILEDIRSAFSLVPETEVTLEANPGVLKEEDLARLVASGVDRISLGVQSFDDEELSRLGRIHSANEAIQAVRAAREAGVRSLSLDLIYGFPGHTLEVWKKTLETALSLAPDHLSLYAFTLEPGTAIHADVRSGRVVLPDEEAVLEMDRLAQEKLTRAGFRFYEISNAARPGAACRHNLRIWKGGDVLGIGAGAHSLLQGRRWRNVAGAEAYLQVVERTGRAAVDVHEVSEREELVERLVRGLRLADGVPMNLLGLGEGKIPARLHPLVSDGFLETAEGFLKLGRRGRSVADSVILEVAACLA